MSGISDHEYYLTREIDERTAAAEAANPDAQAIHLQLADLYAAKAATLQATTTETAFLASRIRRRR